MAKIKKKITPKNSFKKILFLDIDGVLNTESFLNKNWQGRAVKDYSIYIQSELVSELNRIFESVPDLKVVIHSHWGLAVKESKILKALMDKGFLYKSRYLGLTPKKMSSSKFHEIGWWLDDEPESLEYLILDDEEISFEHICKVRPKQRQTHHKLDNTQGLTHQRADAVISWFNDHEPL
jgi:hypothetical protein